VLRTDLTASERKDYIRAVKCMTKLPAQTPPELAPGARSLWDDFVVAHIINVNQAHFSPWMLPWHRLLTGLVEERLREECGMQIGILHRILECIRRHAC
jgi:tyrosinase